VRLKNNLALNGIKQIIHLTVDSSKFKQNLNIKLHNFVA